MSPKTIAKPPLTVQYASLMGKKKRKRPGVAMPEMSKVLGRAADDELERNRQKRLKK